MYMDEIASTSKKRRRAEPILETQYNTMEYTEPTPTRLAGLRGAMGRAAKGLLRFCRRNIFIVVPFVILLAALGYYFVQYQRLAAHNPERQVQEQTAAAVTEIQKLMVISDTSGAQLATITDKSKLAGQAFFANAENGDSLVLFPAAEKAVLYRPSTHKIIEVGPFTSTPDATAGTKTTAPAKTTTKAATSCKAR